VRRAFRADRDMPASAGAICRLPDGDTVGHDRVSYRGEGGVRQP